MADPLGAAGSIIGIAAFGLKFATTLQTYIEAVADARESLRDIAFDVSATASALEQLNEFINIDENGKAIANDSGVQQALRLAAQCKQVYTAIIDLIAKAAGVSRDGNGEESLDALDLDSLNATSLMQRLKWPFKEPRIKKHQEELRWLKISLLFHLRLMELAKTKMMSPARSLNAWEKEVALQATLEKLLSRKEEYARQIAAERRRNKKKARERAKARATGSPIFTAEEIRARDPNPEQITSVSGPGHSLATSEGLFGPEKDKDIAEVKDTSPSEGPIDNPFTFTPNQKPKPTKARFNLNNYNPIPDSITITGRIIEPSNALAAQNIGKQESGAGYLVSSGSGSNLGFPMLAHIPPNPSLTPLKMPSSIAEVVDDKVVAQTNPANASNENDNPHDRPTIQLTPEGSINEIGNPQSQPAAQSSTNSNGNDNNNSRDEKGSQQSHAIQHLNNRYKPRPSRGTFRSLRRLSSLFSKGASFVRDWECRELEAYLIESEPGSTSTSASPSGRVAANTVRKLPFDRRELTSTLRRITKSRKGDLWTQYLSLTSAQRDSIDQAMREAHRSTPHKRTCVAITSPSSPPSQPSPPNPPIILFLALGPPVSPIRFKYGTRHTDFAFELCRTWEGMADMISHFLPDVQDIVCDIQQARYLLKTFDNRVVLPVTWSNVVQPGLMVSLVPNTRSGVELAPERSSMPLPQVQVPHPHANLFGGAAPGVRTPSPEDLEVGGSYHVPGAPGPSGPLGLFAPLSLSREEKGKMIERRLSRMRTRIVESDSDIAARPATDTDVSSIHLTETSDESRPSFGSRMRRVTRSSAPVLERGPEMSMKNATYDESDVEPEEDEDEEVDIIDFEAEQEMAKLGLSGLLGKWTNAFDPPAEDEHK
ncbi:hypothetical protein F5Y06DRAFT_184522 [Hypoxylon sp. FL0890]|nr:hypothetical protein F5Y06DRAFT_184522 [Hypoxylon sp. FL0890]